jgi:hypothetical protein
MHAYDAPGPRSVARTATVLHVLRNSSGAALSLDVEEWRPSPGSAALDSLHADLEMNASCTFAACAGAELVLSLEGARHQLRAPGAGLPLVWFPGFGLRTLGLKELGGIKGLPQWILETEIQDPNSGSDALSSSVDLDIPSALRRAGALEQALSWEKQAPVSDEGPCTVFAVADLFFDPLSPGLLALPGVSLFFDGQQLSGTESTALAGGLCHYAVSSGHSLRVSLRGPLGEKYNGVADSRSRPLRTQDRHRIVHVLH